jgi:type IV secretion system protein VirD4
MLDNRYALLFIRGERPVQDEKFDILRHPNVSGTTDGKTGPYDHGGETRSLCTAQLVRLPGGPAPEPEFADEQKSTYALYSEADLENLFNEENAIHETTENQTEPFAPRPRKKPKPSDDRDEKPLYPDRRRETRA